CRPSGEYRGCESNAGPEVMRVAAPPVTGIVYRSPSSSNTIVLPSGETSRESQVPSCASNSTLRVGVSGSESVLARCVVSGRGAGGFWAATIEAGAYVSAAAANVATRAWRISELHGEKRRREGTNKTEGVEGRRQPNTVEGNRGGKTFTGSLYVVSLRRLSTSSLHVVPQRFSLVSLPCRRARCPRRRTIGSRTRGAGRR